MSNKARKVILYIAVAIILLFVIFWLAVYFALQHIDWKKLVTQQVKEKMGSTLVIKGPLNWHIFPRAGIDITDATLSNPKNFGQGTLLTIKRFNVSVNTWPLMMGHLEVKSFTLDGATINVKTLANGQSNLDFSSPQKPAQPSQKTNQAKVNGKPWLQSVTIPALVIKDANINLVNLKTKQNLHLNDFNFNASDIALNKAFPFSSSFVLKTKALPTGQLKARFSGKATVSQGLFSLTNGKAVLNGLNIKNILLRAKQNTNGLLISPISAVFAKGRLTASYQTQGAQQKVNMNLTQMDVQPVLKAFLGYKKLTGRVSATGQYHLTSGQLKTLNGQGRFEVKQGAYQGVDLAYLYHMAVNTLKPGSMGQLSNHGYTSFGDMTAQYTLQNGQLSTQQLSVVSPVLQISGQANANLPASRLNAKLTLQGMKGDAASPNPTGPKIPFIVSGPFSTLQFKPDLSALIKDKLQDQVEKAVGDKLKNVKGVLGHLFH